jgi:uncharacterized protein YjbI with pentapeptide repeats
MGKQQTVTQIWDRLAGKKVCFQGKFEYGARERMGVLARAHGAVLSDELNAKVDLLIVPDTAGAKGVQSKALALNAKGASIQVVGADDFAKQVDPTDEEVIRALKLGGTTAVINLFNNAISASYTSYTTGAIKRRIASESFAGCDLSDFRFLDTAFEGCDFAGAKLSNTVFSSATRCNFDRAHGPSMSASDASGSTFKGAKLNGATFDQTMADVDFSGADLTQARFQTYNWKRKTDKWPGLVFRNANLTSAIFGDLHLVRPDFEGADLTGVGADRVTIEAGIFRNAALAKATLNGLKFLRCDFSGADLRQTKLVEADLTGCVLEGANLAGCNLRGAKLDGVDLAKTKGYDPSAVKEITAGPALTELDQVAGRTKRIRFSFKLAEPVVSNHRDPDNARTIHADTNGLQWGWGVRTPLTRPGVARTKSTLSDELLSASRLVGDVKIQFETLDISSHKSPLKTAEMRDLITKALCEAFSQEAPDAEKIGAVVKSQRAKDREAAAEARKQREEYKKREEQLKAKETRKIEKKIEKAVGGKVTDIAGFLKALELRADVAKIQKATKMLKAEKFQLFNDITDRHMSGVVKSQTDPDLVYACRIESDGQYACCTQNLNICGGLRGSICKHLLVLIIGLVKAGQLDPATIDTWVAKTRSAKPALDKEVMGEIFIRYKGAEAGEVDWRPTETVPEDYYAL